LAARWERARPRNSGHLGLHSSLDQQPGAKTGDILQDPNQVTVGSEQGIDLATDATGG
jgi:hypothetical protein